jgi:hypothetical protein
MRLQFIEDHRDEFPVSRMCKVLDVSRSGYYAWRRRPPSEREMANQGLYKKVKAVYDRNHGTYGSPRIYRALKRQEVPCSENRVARLMRLHGLRARRARVGWTELLGRQVHLWTLLGAIASRGRVRSSRNVCQPEHIVSNQVVSHEA